MAATFQPYDRLGNRTFFGFLIAEFLAAFNDQCIHASGMFFAINSGALAPDKAISLMPILFYSPWAFFSTLAAYYADKYSKRYSLIFWKVAEVAITIIALLGFWIGSTQDFAGANTLGAGLVLACVFLMGTHSAFYVPCKYGVLPEIFQPHMLSRANGFVESTSFLAVILGTVAGGVLAYVFKGVEYWIGVCLIISALIGTLTSFMIEKMPALDPDKAFPGRIDWTRYPRLAATTVARWLLLLPLFLFELYRPLGTNLRTLLRSRPLALALFGIPFFTFLVAYMRATMYMHGESQNPPWEEFKISLVVGVVALGIGMGSPLAGYLSGGKIELGLVPIGTVVMILAMLVATVCVYLSVTPGMVVALAAIGFFAGFYIVPLYTLFQHHAPKTSKGASVATLNFINVTGAILAQLTFLGLVTSMHYMGFSEKVPVREPATGRLVDLQPRRSISVHSFKVQRPDGRLFSVSGQKETSSDEEGEALFGGAELKAIVKLDSGVQLDSEVTVTTWTLRSRATGEELKYFRIRKAGTPTPPAYDDQTVPIYLFFLGAMLATCTLIGLCSLLPDLFVRSLLWLRNVGRYHLRVVGGKNLPSHETAILVTSAKDFTECMHVVGVTDRSVRFILAETHEEKEPAGVLRFLARKSGLIVLHPGASTAEIDEAIAAGKNSLADGNLVALSDQTSPVAQRILAELRRHHEVPLVPIHVGAPGAAASTAEGMRRVRVVVGEALAADVNHGEVTQELARLGGWLQEQDPMASMLTTMHLPERPRKDSSSSSSSTST
ncbi:MAG TPA: MFS transporter [Gemmatales bacterium]|nr:MFS transporter [Gemmatales bacterium]